MYSIVMVAEFFATDLKEDPVKEEPENAAAEGETRAIAINVAVFISAVMDVNEGSV
jgi:hypothetical protein